jgi:SAM-dependent methyltransferase
MTSGNGRARSPVSLVGSEADVAFYRRQLSQLEQPVLVLGCGNGRLAWELGEGRPSVLGVDPSPGMIALAEEGRARRAPATVGRVRFVTADLRSLRLADRFGAVLAPHNALALMPSVLDLEAMIATARHHLSPGGILLFDAINPSRASGPARDSDGEATLDLWTHRNTFAPHLRERRRVGHGTGESIRRLRLRQFFPAEIDAALEGGGFVATHRYGRYDEKPFDVHDPLQIVAASLQDE